MQNFKGTQNKTRYRGVCHSLTDIFAARPDLKSICCNQRRNNL